MGTVTAAEIKTILGTISTTDDPNVAVNASLLQNDERRKYPSIDIQNITGDETIKDFPTKNIGQTFLIHLFYRYRSFGEEEEPKIKALEELIFNKIDSDTTEFDVPDQKISITQSWRRESETFPVRRSHSILTVSTQEIAATDGTGIPGDTITILFPSPLTTAFTVISLSTDERSINKQLDLKDDAERIFTKISNSDLLIVEVELSTTTEPQLETQVHDGKDISVTLTKNGVAKVLSVNLTSMVGNATRTEVQTTLVTMDVKN